jgi:hypothetical protein
VNQAEAAEQHSRLCGHWGDSAWASSLKPSTRWERVGWVREGELDEGSLAGRYWQAEVEAAGSKRAEHRSCCCFEMTDVSQDRIMSLQEVES